MGYYNIYKPDCLGCGKSMELIDSSVDILSVERIEKWSCHKCKKTFFTSWSCTRMDDSHEYEKESKLVYKGGTGHGRSKTKLVEKLREELRTELGKYVDKYLKSTREEIYESIKKILTTNTPGIKVECSDGGKDIVNVDISIPINILTEEQLLNLLRYYEDVKIKFKVIENGKDVQFFI